jgi:hypothetical protein
MFILRDFIILDAVALTKHIQPSEKKSIPSPILAATLAARPGGHPHPGDTQRLCFPDQQSVL